MSEMGTERAVIAALVEEGSLKKAFQAGVVDTDFTMYEEEWNWLTRQTEQRKTINWRRFQKTFPDFEKVVENDRTVDLIEDLKNESGYMQFSAALEQTAEELTPDNFVEKADFLREALADVLRIHSPSSDLILSGDVKGYLQRMKDNQLLVSNGESLGIPTGIKTLDSQWGGLRKGNVYAVLGRPGDAKSYIQAKFFVSGFLEGRRMAMFSPEMNEDAHRARVATLISAYPHVQEELGLGKAFRNRALMDGKGYNYKTLKRLWEWIAQQQGEMILFTQKFRMQKMTPGYIESKIDDLAIDCAFVDPIYKLRPSQRAKYNGPEKIAQITDELCDIAIMHDMPLVMSNQAHRQLGNRGDAPTKDNSFNSDAPAQEADCVFGVKHITDERKLIVRCTKNRFGAEFRVDLKFLPNIGVMQDMEQHRDPGYYNGHEDGSDEQVKEAVNKLEKEMGYQKT